MPAQLTWDPIPAYVPVREGLADTPGAKLWYWDTGGEGEPIVLLHPGTGSAFIWGYQQPVFARAGYRVIGFSRRGHTKSEIGPENDPGTAAADLNNLVDFLKVKRFHIVGTGGGGYVVPDYALSYPDRLLSMTIACSQAGITEPAYQELVADLAPKGFAGLPASFRELGPSYRAGNRPGVEAWEALERTSLAPGARLSVPRLKNRLFREDFARIRTPALVFTGGAELYAPFALVLQYASQLPNVETAILEESGHSGYWEQPRGFNQLVLDFVRKHSVRKR
jgi:pimeloyl-ACP methyl ester carboxylesterase